MGCFPRFKVLALLCLISVALFSCSLAQSLQDGDFWDGTETVTYEIVVRDAVTKRLVDGATVTLLLGRVPKLYDHSVTTDKTVAGVATVKGTFFSGGSHTDEGFFSDIAVRGAKLRCNAEGYQLSEEPLAPILHFKPKEPRAVKIEIYLKPK